MPGGGDVLTPGRQGERFNAKAPRDEDAKSGIRGFLASWLLCVLALRSVRVNDFNAKTPRDEDAKGGIRGFFASWLLRVLALRFVKAKRF